MKLTQLFEDVFNTDLDALYRKFNAKYFNNELPIVKTIWTNKTRSAGAVVATIHRNMGAISHRDFKTTIVIKHLEISKHTKISIDKLYGLMLHEMIHVYMFANNIIERKDAGHGVRFHAKLKELQKIAPFDIPVTEDITDSEISDHIKSKPTVVIIRDNEWVHALTEKSLHQNVDDIIKRFRQGMEYDIILTDSNVLTKIPVARTLNKRGIGYYQMNPTDIQKLRDSMIKRFVRIDKKGNLTE